MKLRKYHKQQKEKRAKRQSLKKHRRVAIANRKKELPSTNVVSSLIDSSASIPTATSCQQQLQTIDGYWSDGSIEQEDNNNTKHNSSGMDDTDNDDDVDNNSLTGDEGDESSSEYIVSELDSEDEQFKKHRILQEFKFTLREPLESHMSDNIGGNLPPKRQQSTVNRLAELLAWSSDKIETDRKTMGDSTTNYNNDVPVVDPHSLVSVLAFLCIFITAKFALLGQFTTYLESAKRLSPSTIINWLNDLSYSFKWYVYTWSLNADPLKIPLTTTLDPVNMTIRNLRSSLRKAVRRINSRKTVESEVEAGRRPKEGMKKLIQFVREKVLWARSLTKNSFKNLVTFREFMKLLYASLYTSYGQGRLGGIQSLNFGQSTELLNKRTTSTTHFKTYSKYGFQFVTVEKESYEFFDIYLRYARPAIVERFHLWNTLGSGFGNEKEKAAQPLWLNASGKRDLDLSRKVTDFFKPYGMHITTTIVRSMIATESQEMLDDGIITRGEMEGIAKTSGICIVHYKKR